MITLDSPGAAEHALGAIRRRWPGLPVVMRARDGAHAAHLLAMGAAEVVPETVEASLQLAGRVLEGLEVPHDAADQLIGRLRVTMVPAAVPGGG